MSDPDRDARNDWFTSLTVKGDFTPGTLDGYFATVQGWLKDDMIHLRKPIARWRGRSDLIRFTAFVAVALGVLLPLPIFGPLAGGPSGLELGYLAVLLGGLVLMLDRVFNVSNSWMRLTLAEMQMRQVRYRLDLEWAKRRPALGADNEATEGPALIDVLRTAMDAGHEIMETQKESWTSELKQALEALKGRLDDDRIALERLRTERRQEQARPKAGAVNLTLDKPGDLKGPLVIKVGEEQKVKMDTVPTRASVNNVPAGLQTITIEAVRAADDKPFAYSVTDTITAGEVKTITVTVS